MTKRGNAASIFTALGFGVVFYLIVPLGLMFILNILLSAATVLDPLHAKKHLADTWSGFVTTAVFQIGFLIIVGLATSILSGFLADKIRSGWVYVAAAGMGLATHYLFLAIFGGIVYLATSDEVFGTYIVLFMVFVTITGPLLGICCIAVSRRRSKYFLNNITGENIS